MIELSQLTNLSAFSSMHYIQTEFPEGVRHWTLSGIADLSAQLKGAGATWRREWVLLTLQIPNIGQNAVRVQQWVPLVTLQAICNEGDGAGAGWAVESFHLMDGTLHQVPARPGSLMRTATLGCGVKVRHAEGYVLRLAYTMQLVGTLEPVALQ